MIDLASTSKEKIYKKTKIFELNTKKVNMEEAYDLIKDFYDPQQSKYHLKILERKMFKCPLESCMRVFKEKGNLKTHIRVHTGERPFKCNFDGCTKSFITLGNLKSHVLNHTGERPYECSFPECNKKYSRLCRLKIHLRTHIGDKPFKCPFKDCGKLFNEKGNLKTHFRIHTGEKPYLCKHPGCNHSFKAHGHLKDHEKRHNNSKPYVCDVCGAKFARSSTVKIHKHTHTGERPHICPVEGCNKRFSEKGNMRTHMKIHMLKNFGKIKIKKSEEDIQSNCSISNISKMEHSEENENIVVDSLGNTSHSTKEKSKCVENQKVKLESKSELNNTIPSNNCNENSNKPKQNHLNFLPIYKNNINNPFPLHQNFFEIKNFLKSFNFNYISNVNNQPVNFINNNNNNLIILDNVSNSLNNEIIKNSFLKKNDQDEKNIYFKNNNDKLYGITNNTVFSNIKNVFNQISQNLYFDKNELGSNLNLLVSGTNHIKNNLNLINSIYTNNFHHNMNPLFISGNFHNNYLNIDHNNYINNNFASYNNNCFFKQNLSVPQQDLCKILTNQNLVLTENRNNSNSLQNNLNINYNIINNHRSVQ